MKIDTIVMGDFQTNCYCIRKDNDSHDCLILDPGLEAEPLVHLLRQNNWIPVDILLTHGHVDHIGGVETLRQYWPNVRVAVHQSDAAMLTDPTQNLSLIAGCMVQTQPADILLDSEDVYYTSAGLRFKILHVPGHSPGGICLYDASEHVLFSGDTLFAASIGRTDFPGGSHEQLIEMIRHKLLVLPGSTRVYPGHGPATVIGNEKKFNPFLGSQGL
jgi:glyoxylase-like metal-dependent hydrolase (beta-lactamase superfamily II)